MGIEGEHIDGVLSFIDGEHCTIRDAVIVAKIRGSRFFERTLFLRILLGVSFERLDDRADRRPKQR